MYNENTIVQNPTLDVAAPIGTTGPIHVQGQPNTNVYTVGGSGTVGNLADIRNQKISTLNARKGYGATDRTNTLSVEDGYVDNMSNKIMNDYAPHELAYIQDRLYREKGLHPDGQGGYLRMDESGNMAPYTGYTGTHGVLYDFKTLDGNNKIGTEGSLSAQNRYSAERMEKYNRDGKSVFIGPKGVDVNALNSQYILPKQWVDTLEGLKHGNKYWLENRVVRRGENESQEAYNARAAEYGTGFTEVYRPMDTTPPEGFNGDAVWQDFATRFGYADNGYFSEEELAQQYRNARHQREYEEGLGFAGRAGNALAGFATAFVRDAAVDTADMFLEMFGSDALGTDEQKAEMVNSWFDYNPVFADKAAEKVKEQVQSIYTKIQNDEDIDISDVYGLVKESVFNPELLATSLGAIAALLIPAKKAVAVGREVGKVEKLFRAGKIDKAEAKAQIQKARKDAGYLKTAAAGLLGVTPFASVVAGNVNDRLDEFAENNNGQWDTSDVLRITAIESAIVGMDKFSAGVIMDNVPLLNKGILTSKVNALKEVAGSLELPDYLRMMKPAVTAAKKLATVGGGAALEGATEYIQTVGEIFSAKYFTEKYGEDALSLFLSEETQVEAFTGAALGTGMGAEMSGYNMVGDISMVGARKGATTLLDKLPAGGNQPDSQVAPQASISEDAVKEAKELYGTTLTSLQDSVDNKTLSLDTLADALEALDTLKRNRWSVEDSNKHDLAVADEVYSTVRKNVYDLIMTAKPEEATLLKGIFAETNMPQVAAQPEVTSEVEVDEIDALLEADDTNTSALMQKIKDEGKSTTLGSSPKQQVELTEERRKANTAHAVELFAEQVAGKPTNEEKNKLFSFAKANGLDTKRVEAILLSFASVEDESIRGDRGVEGRTRRFESMKASGTTKNAEFQQEYDETVNFYATTANSILQLEQGIAEAKRRAETANKSATKKLAKADQVVTTEYITHSQSKSKGAPYTIRIKQVDGVWEAEVANPQKLIDVKKVTKAGLENLLNRYHQEVRGKLNADAILSTDGYTVPAISEKAAESAKTERKKEAEFITRVKEALATSSGNTPTINKVILADSRNGLWKATEAHARINSPITNMLATKGVAYKASDVVIVQSSGTVAVGTSKYKRSEFYRKDMAGTKEIEAAIEAGATIVFGNTSNKVFNNGKRADGTVIKNTNLGLFQDFMKAKGYVPLGINAVESKIFVPSSESAMANLATKTEAKNSIDDTAAKKRKANKALVDLEIEREAVLAGFKGRTLAEVDADIITAREKAKEFYTKDTLEVEAKNALIEDAVEEVDENAIETTVISDIDDDIDADAIIEESVKTTDASTTSVEDISADPEVNMQKHAETGAKKAIKEAKKLLRTALKDGALVELASPELEFLANTAVAADAAKDGMATTALTAWKDAARKKLKGQELLNAINKALEATGIKIGKDGDIKPKSVAEELLSNSYTADVDTKAYMVRIAEFDSNGKVTILERGPKFSREKYPVGKKFKMSNGKNAEIIAVDELRININDYVEVKKATPLNSLPATTLPEIFKEIGSKTKDTLLNSLAKMTTKERDLSKPNSMVDKSDIFKAIDSPARAIFFDKEGNLNESAAIAVGIAVRDLLSTEKFKLLLGPKDTKTVAAMFNVQETQVTKEMRDFAKSNGMFLKSAASTLGKSVASALGLGRKANNEISRGHYERLMADIGNAAIEVAIAQDLLEITSTKSNDLAKLYQDGEVLSGEEAGSVTYLINMKSSKSKENGVTRNVPTSVVNRALKDREEIEELIPDVVSFRKEPFYKTENSEGNVPAERKREATSKIRNDHANAQIPKEAKQALEIFMDTSYEADVKLLNNFAELMKDSTKAAQIKARLGYIEVSNKNKAYAELMYEDKVIQEAINRDIEKSIEEVLRFAEDLENGVENVMHFPFYYTTNQRYMLDSNTINPQTDKLHRFIFQPSALNTEYEVDHKDGTFTYRYTDKNGESKAIDSSLYVRAALNQAFGVGIDKTSTDKIVRLGNALLSLNNDQINALETALLRDGEVELNVGTETFSLEAEHLSHSLQALNFLRDYEARTPKMSSYLSFEMDALTSGFANKTQQFGLFDSSKDPNNTLQVHAERVGIVQNIAGNPTHALIKDEKLGMNDLLSDKTRNDSYKNLGAIAIRGVDKKRNELKSVTHKNLLEALLPILPGGKLLGVDNPVIDSALRSMFKAPFMIFNYSASIDRIVKNLGHELVHGLVAAINKLDTSNTDSAEYKAAAALVNVIDRKMSVDDFIEKLRNEPLSAFKIKVATSSKPEGETYNLDQYLIDNLLTPTYGDSVREAFESAFADFIRIQDTTNDLFKMSFAAFNELLLDKVKAFRKEGSVSITDEDMLRFIEELRPAFPVIVGPLSDALSDGIHIYSTDTKTPNTVMQTVTSPALHLSGKGETRTRKVNLLLKSMVSAANAGAVLPFHALDGAQMARTAIEAMTQLGLEHSGFLPVHDAIICKLPLTDLVGYIYNKTTVELNSSYSIIDSLVEMGTRLESILEGKHPTLSLKGKDLYRVRGLKVGKTDKIIAEKEQAIKDTKKALEEAKKQKNDEEIARLGVALTEKNAELTFSGDFQSTLLTVKGLQQQIQQARSTVFPEGTYVSAMVGLRGSMYKTGSTEADLDYLDNYHVMYDKVDVDIHTKEVPEDSKPTAASEETDAEAEVMTDADINEAADKLGALFGKKKQVEAKEPEITEEEIQEESVEKISENGMLLQELITKTETVLQELTSALEALTKGCK